MVRAKSISIVLLDGDPSGLRLARLTSRTVLVLDVPRARLSDFCARPESSRPGVYFLTDGRGVYVGESDNCADRLRSHSQTFWDRALVAVSTDNGWHKTHVRHMEAEFIALAKSGSYAVANNNSGYARSTTPPEIRADCEEFAETIELLLATLGADFTAPADQPAPVGGEVFELSGQARGRVTPEGFEVLAASRLRADHPDPHGSGRTLSRKDDYVESLRAGLLRDGVLGWEGDTLVFVRDHAFGSPRQAKQVITCDGNGWEAAWRSPTGTVADRWDNSLRRRRPSQPTVTIGELLGAGLLVASEELSSDFGTAVVTPEGRLAIGDQTFATPSGAGQFLTDKPTNGWEVWFAERDGEPVSLMRLRDQYRDSLS